jgi:hypothetical protein
MTPDLEEHEGKLKGARREVRNLQVMQMRPGWAAEQLTHLADLERSARAEVKLRLRALAYAKSQQREASQAAPADISASVSRRKDSREPNTEIVDKGIIALFEKGFRAGRENNNISLRDFARELERWIRKEDPGYFRDPEQNVSYGRWQPPAGLSAERLRKRITALKKSARIVASHAEKPVSA